jgi:succinate dehydrogenase / fumarate reductase flavoprotein subunit
MPLKEKAAGVLVIGGGGAGLRAALAAVEKEPSAKVLLLTKGRLGTAGVTARACSDRMAFHVALEYTEPGGPDNWKYHAQDVYRIGGYVSDGDLAALQAAQARLAFAYLDRLRVPFVKGPDGRATQFVTDGSDYARACYTGPHTANHIHQALLRQLRTTTVEVLEESMLADLLVDEAGRCCGALCLTNLGRGRPTWLAIAARAVILATGGAGELFAVNVFPEGMTGDGYAAALRAGGELVNLEFIQIGISSVATKLACSGSMFRALPRLINDRGEEFLARSLDARLSPGDRLELLFRKGASWPVSYEAPTRIIDIAVFKEIQAGRKVFLDFRRNSALFSLADASESIRTRYRDVEELDLSEPRLAQSPLARLQAINPQAVTWLQERGVDLRAGDLVEVAPAIQHFQGGVKINTRAQTTVPGLYACGECAGGQHGANRPGGNALMDAQVFGRIAGESALAEPTPDMAAVGQLARKALAALSGALDQPTGLAPHDLREQVQQTASEAASVMRVGHKLSDALAQVADLRARGVRAEEGEAPEALEALNLLAVAEMVLSAALLRDESRGPHLRFRSLQDLTPLPRRSPQWDRYIVIKRSAGRLLLTPRTPTPLPFAEIT